MEVDAYDPLFESPDAPTADTPDSPPDTAARNAELALNLRDNAPAGWLYWITNSTLGEQIGPDAFLVFRKLMLEEAGDPSDPVERMLIEQLALAHFSIGQLRIRSCMTDVPKLTLAFSDSATRLLGEFRRCSLALEEYRSKREARTEKRGVSETASPPPAAKLNGHASVNGNGKHFSGQLHSNGTGQHADVEAAPLNGDMPAWLKKRLAFPTPGGSKPAAATASNGAG